MTATTFTPALPGENGLPERRIGWALVIAFFGIFLGWATLVRLDAAVTAQGTIAVAGDRKAVQNMDGGIISALHVHEGQWVREGEPLIDLATNEIVETDHALASQLIDARAMRARLLAETAHVSITAPAEFAALTGDERGEADRAMTRQRAVMANRGEALADQHAVLQRQSAQYAQQIVGINRRVDSDGQQAHLLGEELNGMRELAAAGFASVNRIRALERSQADLSGQTGNYMASIAAAREQIGETAMQAQGLDAQAVEHAGEELHAVENAIADLLPRYRVAHERLDRARVRATATGRIVGLTVHTVGGIVQAGAVLMEIVPDAAPLVIESEISPMDAADLTPGQTVQVHIPALHDRGLPVLNGSVERVSADALHDERSGAHFYQAVVTVPVQELEKVEAMRGDRVRLRPGLPASIMVPLHKRTLLQYLLEPLHQALWQSGSER